MPGFKDLLPQPPWEGPPIPKVMRGRESADIRIAPEATYINNEAYLARSIKVVMGPREEEMSHGAVRSGQSIDIDLLISAYCK